MPNFDLLLLSARICSPSVTMATLVDGTGVLLNLKGQEVLTFNDTGMLIVNGLREKAITTLEGLVDAITSEFEIDDETARQDAEAFLTRLSEAFSEHPGPS